jgi:CubicO group peptidase (beta-lactamase class C family)
MASAGKFITHIAVLQCVDRGLITLDEPISTYFPALENLNVLSKNEGLNASTEPFSLAPATKKITLRHLLTYSSGLAFEWNSILPDWRKSKGEEPRTDYRKIDEGWNTPLLFEPGEGWHYGASIGFTQALIQKLTNKSFVPWVQEHIFDPLGMSSSTYSPQDNPDISSKLLQKVRRVPDGSLEAAGGAQGLVCSVPSMLSLMTDLISSSSQILTKESIDLLFEPQFTPTSAALLHLRQSADGMYADCSGIPTGMSNPPVNHTCAALLVEEELPLSHMPKGTVTWNGMPNVIWAMNREKGLSMIWATQLVPADDEKTMELAMEFFRGAWSKFV